MLSENHKLNSEIQDYEDREDIQEANFSRMMLEEESKQKQIKTEQNGNTLEKINKS